MQHDYNLINQSGADFRADLNNALSAIATNNSGTSEPSTTFGYEWWIDEANGVLKIRNSANSAWITTGLSLTTNNTFTGDITGNAATATILATTRTINGVSFNGSANISFNTDSVAEGSSNLYYTSARANTDFDTRLATKDTSNLTEGSNLYFTNERVDDRVDDLLVAGTGISLTYDDVGNTLTIANTNDADITGVVAGAALTGGGTSGDVTLNVAVDDSSIEINTDALRIKASGITNAMLAGSIANSKLSNSSVTINSQSLALGGSLDLDTSEIPENTNLYFTTERTQDVVGGMVTGNTESGIAVTYDDADGTLDFVVQTLNQDTSGNAATATILETARTISGIGFNGSADITLNTSTITENTNLYYTQTRFDTAFGNKSTANLTENTNLYFTNERVDDRVSALIQDGTGISFSYNDGENTLTPTITLSPFNTSNLSESGNLYYTDARANSAIDARVTNTFINNLTGVVADTATALATARTIALAGDVVGSVSFDGTSNVSITTAIQADSVALGTDTTGDYIQTITGTANKITVSGSGTESRDVTLTLPDDVQIANNLVVANNLTVNGTLTSLDTTNLDIEDNLFQLNAGLTGTPVNDSGMLINRGNQNNAVFIWDESADKFTLGLTTADGSATGNITLSALGTLVANIDGAVTGTVSSLSNHDTADLAEGTNLYYTQARFDTAFGNKSTADLSENTNLYYTEARVTANSSVAANTAKVGITPAQASAITANTAKITYPSADSSKLAGIEAQADVTDVANVTAAGALMDSELTSIASVKALNQGVATGDSPTFVAVTGTLATAAQPNITSVGTLSALTVDNFTLDGTTLALSSGDMTLDVAGNIHLDSGSGEIRFYDGGTYFGKIRETSGNLEILSGQIDKDILFIGNDNGTPFTALTLDMSDAGAATFNAGATFGAGIDVTGSATMDGLGIGTTSPSALLHINSLSQVSNRLAIFESDINNLNEYSSISVGSSTLSATFGLMLVSSDTAYVGVGSSGNAFDPTTGSGLYVNANGNVGIGVTSPSALLDVAYGDYQNSGALRIGADIGTNTSRTNSTRKIGIISAPHYTNAEDDISVLMIDSEDNACLLSIGGTASAMNSPSSIAFVTSSDAAGTSTGIERLRIDSVGETTIKRAGSGGSGVLKALNLNHAGTSVNDGAKISFTAGSSTEGAGIASTGQALNSADLRFYTGGNTERMRIASNGRTSIGTTTTNAGLTVANGDIRATGAAFANDANSISLSQESSGSYITSRGSGGSTKGTISLSVNEDDGGGGRVGLKIENDASVTMAYMPSGSASSDVNINLSTNKLFYVSSSQRYKTNITDLSTSTTDILSLRPVNYDRVSEELTGEVGLIAEEVYEIIPHLVNLADVDGFDTPQPESVKYSQLSVYLLKAIQEQQALIETLTARVEQLEN